MAIYKVLPSEAFDENKGSWEDWLTEFRSGLLLSEEEQVVAVQELVERLELGQELPNGVPLRARRNPRRRRSSQ